MNSEDRKCRLKEYHLGVMDPWPYHLTCSSCHAVYSYFDCYTTTGSTRVLRMRYCMRCGAEVTPNG